MSNFAKLLQLCLFYFILFFFFYPAMFPDLLYFLKLSSLSFACHVIFAFAFALLFKLLLFYLNPASNSLLISTTVVQKGQHECKSRNTSAKITTHKQQQKLRLNGSYGPTQVRGSWQTDRRRARETASLSHFSSICPPVPERCSLPLGGNFCICVETSGPPYIPKNKKQTMFL